MQFKKWSLVSFCKQWCSKAFRNVNVVPPDVGAVHQVNLEYLSRVIQLSNGFIYPDSVVGTDSHTTMINGLGILGWGKSFLNVLDIPFLTLCSKSETCHNSLRFRTWVCNLCLSSLQTCVALLKSWGIKLKDNQINFNNKTCLKLYLDFPSLNMWILYILSAFYQPKCVRQFVLAKFNRTHSISICS